MTSEIQATRAAIDSVYAERNALVMAFATLAWHSGWKVGVRFSEVDPEWPVVLIDTPAGQCSWHVPRDSVPDDFPAYEGEWDGHSTTVKYERLQKIVM